MELLRELLDLQCQHGYLADQQLEELAQRRGVPRYRIEGLVSFYSQFRRTPPPTRQIAVCRDVVCKINGCDNLRTGLEQLAKNDEELEIVEVSCLGRCDHAPAVAVNHHPAGPATDAGYLLDDNTVPWLEVPGPRGWQADPYPTVDDRYNTLAQLVSDLPALADSCISRLNDAGLRGMGGAGFPTGRKWELVAAESSDTKYVICNADESEPGTFKDRMLLATLPHLVIEGMVLAGLTVGAARGIVFLRHEYSIEQEALETAILDARARGVLGPDAAGSGRPFEIEIFTSPGGYILGEETALLEALEDRRGEPRNKPPYPGQVGLFGEPTLINNVETFVLSVPIIALGGDWWTQQGAEGFSGLKFVSISGDVTQPGVYEIPVGTTVADLIEQAGGVRDGAAVRAFLPGGASSRFLPADRLDTPLDFDTIANAGSMLGTGAVIIIAEGHDLFDLATNLVQFFRNESCGKCVPCRIGSHHAVGILERVTDGTTSSDSLEELPALAQTLEQTSICGLGQVALVPILSMLEHFPDEVPRP
ncbi:MAG: NADH-ubiquinone oxidoreductase-F iron-sulfur binding region domain-containing protein [Planctomycetota bacterium]|nr:NADH-ubiquinone oxidoreductase-F iron-sulfur binding region domain-containing protein [Planctomycetota bacterium]